MSANTLGNHTEISLESTILAFTNWRTVKNQHGGSNKPIPSELWDMVFTLESKGLPARSLKAALGISSTQYKNQKAKREVNNPGQQVNIDNKAENALFAEAVVKPSKAELEQKTPELSGLGSEALHQIKQLKTTDNSKHELNPNTVIVECFHSDGHRLKIHATSEKMSEIFGAFFHQPAAEISSC